MSKTYNLNTITLENTYNNDKSVLINCFLFHVNFVVSRKQGTNILLIVTSVVSTPMQILAKTLHKAKLSWP